MKLTKKQQERIKAIEWFMPEAVKDWGHKHVRASSYAILGLNSKKKNWKLGLSAEEAYFLKTDKGILAGKVSNTPRFASLLQGHRYMALQMTMWKEDFEKGLLFPEDFKNEPDYIKKLAQQCCEQTGRIWNVT